jgi:uncharacterized protein YjbI with pentapeptide repeats
MKIHETILDLSHQIVGHTDYSNTIFKERVIANHAQFTGLCWFKNAVFEKGFEAEHALFHSDARFDSIKTDSLNVTHAEFRGVADFDKAQITAANFSHITAYGNFSLEETTLKATHFTNAHFYGGLWAHKTRFEGEVDFKGAEVHGRTNLSEAYYTKSPLAKLLTYGING